MITEYNGDENSIMLTHNNLEKEITNADKLAILKNNIEWLEDAIDRLKQAKSDYNDNNNFDIKKQIYEGFLYGIAGFLGTSTIGMGLDFLIKQSANPETNVFWAAVLTGSAEAIYLLDSLIRKKSINHINAAYDNVIELAEQIRVELIKEHANTPCDNLNDKLNNSIQNLVLDMELYNSISTFLKTSFQNDISYKKTGEKYKVLKRTKK